MALRSSRRLWPSWSLSGDYSLVSFWASKALFSNDYDLVNFLAYIALFFIKDVYELVPYKMTMILEITRQQ